MTTDRAVTNEYHLHVEPRVLPGHGVLTDPELDRLLRIIDFRRLPWYRRAWLTLTGKAPR